MWGENAEPGTNKERVNNRQDEPVSDISGYSLYTFWIISDHGYNQCLYKPGHKKKSLIDALT